MAHDGQDPTMNQPVILPNLLALTADAIPAAESTLDKAKTALKEAVTKDGRVNNGLIESNQFASHGFAWLATYVEAIRQMHKWAERLNADGKFGEVEQLIHQIAAGEYLWQIYGGIPMNQGEVVRLQDIGLTQDDMRDMMVPAVMTLTQEGNTQAARTRLAVLMEEQSANVTVGATGLDEELEMIREQFRRFSVDRVEPHARWMFGKLDSIVQGVSPALEVQGLNRGVILAQVAESREGPIEVLGHGKRCHPECAGGPPLVVPGPGSPDIGRDVAGMDDRLN